MKKSLLFLLVTLLGGTTLHAYDALIDGIYYNFSGNEATVTYQKYDGYGFYNDYSGSVVIPASVTYSGKTYSVTSIGASAFRGCTRLTSVTIPESVTSIGASAFESCSSNISYYSGLSSITIPKSVTSIGANAFSLCFDLTSVHITDLTAWCNISFSGGYSNPLYFAHHLYLNGEEITNLIIPGEVTSIGDEAFYGCTGLTSVTIPEGVTSIGDYAFNGCTSLTSITIPESVTSIGDYAFYNCTSLTSVTIPEGVTSIGRYAFLGCSSLTSVHITDLAAWCNISFSGDSSNPFVFAHHLYLNGEEITNLTIPEEVTSIGDFAFYNCTSLTSITIPKSVTSIGASAFCNCSSLTSVHITDLAAWCNISFSGGYSNPLYFAHHLYLNGEEITNLTIPEEVTSIGDFAFQYCTSLTSVTIPESVTTIGYYAFYGCSNLALINIPEGITSIGLNAFSGTAWYNNQPNGLLYIGNIVYKYFGTMPEGTQIEIKAGTVGIASQAFRGCSGLTSITIPGSVTSIGDEAFYGCTGLTSITIPNSVTSIGSSAFRYCSSLTSITIPEGVTSIGGSTFYGCSSLASITIPSTLTSVNRGAFSGCSSLSKVIVPDIAAWCGITYEGDDYTGDFPLGIALHLYSDENTEITEVVIPEGVTRIEARAFRDAKYVTSVTIPRSVTYIGPEAFRGMHRLTSINLPQGITSIERLTFHDCQALCSVSIPEGVTSILGSAFRGCQALRSVSIPEGVTSFSDLAFDGCSGLTSITIPKSAADIDASALSGCYFVADSLINLSDLTSERNWGATIYEGEETNDGLFIKWKDLWELWGCRPWVKSQTSITIPEGVMSIGDGVFSSYNLLINVTIPSSMTRIGRYAFQDCTGLTSITIPEGVTYIGPNAFRGCYFMKGSFVNNSELTSANYWGATIYDEEPDEGLLIKDNVVIKYRGTSSFVTIPDYVTSIGNSAFSRCSNLTSITIPESVTSIGNSAFNGCSNLTSITIPESVTSIGNSAFSGCSSLTSVTIPDGVTSIGESTFQGCSSLTSVIIPESVTSISEVAFYACSGLTSVTINSDAVASKSYSNSSCISNIFGPQVTQYILGEGVQKIGKYAFYSCSNLLSVILPSSLTSIGGYAFQDCTGLKEIYCHAEEVPSATSSVFKGVTTSNVLLVVPDDAVEKYKAHSVWKKFMIEDATDTPSLMAEDRKADGIYDMSGRRVEKLQRGINIIRMSDGTTRKVMVK